VKTVIKRLNFFCLLCAFVCVQFALYADGGLYLFPKGAKAKGTGGNGLLNVDLWAVYNNQAAMAHIENINAGLHYESRFASDKLGVNVAAFVMPALTGVFGFNVAHLGFDMYGETRIGMGYGKKLAKRLSLGIQFNYHLLNFYTGYSTVGTFTGEIGLLAMPLDNLFIGAHVFNPTLAKLGSEYEESVNMSFEIGAGYRIAGRLMLMAEVYKDKDDKMSPRFGADYSLFKSLSLRTGASLKPLELCFGVGCIVKKRLNLDFAFYHHNTLGFNPQISLAYRFGK
jgi:hypothetical protein